MNARSWNSILGAVLLALGAQAKAAGSDILLLHGHIYTGAQKLPWVQALAVTGSRIDAVGTDSELLERRGPATRVIDLHGRTVIPGIVDGHIHVWLGALALHGINLSTPEASITPAKRSVVIQRIRDYAAAHPAEKLIFGRMDFSPSPPFSPSYELLDQAVGDRPIIVHNISEHAMLLNSKALALVGITDKPLADPVEERNVVRDASGHPTGVIIEGGMEIVERYVKSVLSVEEQLSMIQAATRQLNSFGVTSVVNATGDLAEIKLYAALRDRGALTVRTRTAFGAVSVPQQLTPQFLADLEAARSTYHDEWVSANLVKFFADGFTGLIAPLVYKPAEFKSLVLELDRRGYQLMTHATRFDTVHMVLDAYEEAERANGARDRRLRIEHSSSVREADFPRYAALSVINVTSPGFCCGESGTNADPKEPTPSDQWQSFLKNGVVMGFSSDWPCSWPANPSSACKRPSRARFGIPTTPRTSSIYRWMAPLWQERAPRGNSTLPSNVSRCGRPSTRIPRAPRTRTSRKHKSAAWNPASSQILRSSRRTYSQSLPGRSERPASC